MNMKRFVSLVGAIVLGMGLLTLFFGGTLEGAKFGLMILGAIFLFQISYKAITEDKNHEK